MKDTEVIRRLQKQYIETQQKLSRMNELIIRNNENNNYLSDKMIEGLFGLINPHIKFFEERVDAYTVDLVYDYRQLDYYLVLSGNNERITPADDLDSIIGENYDYFCLREALRHIMNLYKSAGYRVSEDQISLQKTECKETEFWSYKQQYIYRWTIHW